MIFRSVLFTALLSSFPLFAADPLLVRDLVGKQVIIEPSKAVTVVTFISTQCPISNDYNDRMSAIYKDYSAKGVHLFFVNANSTESASEIAEHAKSVGFNFPVYKDENAADKLGAQTTPQAFVFDKSGKLLYQGYIDDARNVARIQNHGLTDAIDAALAGKPVANPVTRAFGCTIKKARRS